MPRLLLYLSCPGFIHPGGAQGEQAGGVRAGLRPAAWVRTLLCPFPGKAPSLHAPVYPAVLGVGTKPGQL